LKLETYEFDRAISYKHLAGGSAAEVDAFVEGTSADLDVPKDSKSSSSCFLFPHFSAPLELAEGGNRLLDSVFSESPIPFPSHLSVVSGASLSKADSWHRSPSSRSGG
jgi:hypothetical protein